MANRFTIYFGWSPCTQENKKALLDASLGREGTRNSLLSNKNYINLFTPTELATLIEKHRPLIKKNETKDKYKQRCDKYDEAMAKRLLPHFNTPEKIVKLVQTFNAVSDSSRAMVRPILNHPGIKNILLSSALNNRFVLDVLMEKKEGLGLLLSSPNWAKRVLPNFLALITHIYYKNYKSGLPKQEQEFYEQTLQEGYKRLSCTEGSISFRLAMANQDNFSYIVEKMDPNHSDVFVRTLALEFDEVVQLCEQYPDPAETKSLLDKYFLVVATKPSYENKTAWEITCKTPYLAHLLLNSPSILSYLKTTAQGISWPFLMSLLSFYEENTALDEATLDCLLASLMAGEQQEALVQDLLNHLGDEENGRLRYPVALTYLLKKYPNEVLAKSLETQEQALKAPTLLKHISETSPQSLEGVASHSLVRAAVCIPDRVWLTSFMGVLGQLGKSLLSFMNAEDSYAFENTRLIYQNEALAAELTDDQILEHTLQHQDHPLFTELVNRDFSQILHNRKISLNTLIDAEVSTREERRQHLWTNKTAQQPALWNQLSPEHQLMLIIEHPEEALPNQETCFACAQRSFDFAKAIMTHRYEALSPLDKIGVLITYQSNLQEYQTLLSLLTDKQDSLYQFAMADEKAAELLLSSHGKTLIAREHWTNEAIEILAQKYGRNNKQEEKRPPVLAENRWQKVEPQLIKKPQIKLWLSMITDWEDFKTLSAAQQVKQVMSFAANNDFRQFLNTHIAKINKDFVEKLLQDKDASLQLLSNSALLKGWSSDDNQPLLRYQDRLRLAVKHQLLKLDSGNLLPVILCPTGERSDDNRDISLNDLEKQFFTLLANEVNINPRKVVKSVIASRENPELTSALYKALEQSGHPMSTILNTRHKLKDDSVYKQLTAEIFKADDNQWLLAGLSDQIFAVVNEGKILSLADLKRLRAAKFKSVNEQKRVQKYVDMLLQAVVENPSIAKVLLQSQGELERSICKYVFTTQTPLTNAVLAAFAADALPKAITVSDHIGGKQVLIEGAELQNRLLNLAKDYSEIALSLARTKSVPLSLVLKVFGSDLRASQIREQMGAQNFIHLAMKILSKKAGFNAMTNDSWGIIFETAAKSHDTATQLLTNSTLRQVILSDKNHIAARYDLLEKLTLASPKDDELLKLKKALGIELNKLQRREEKARELLEQELLQKELLPLIANNDSEQVKNKVREDAFKKAVSEPLILTCMKAQTEAKIVQALAFHSSLAAKSALQNHYFTAVQIAELLVHHVKKVDDALLTMLEKGYCQHIDFDSLGLLEPWSLLSIAKEAEARTILLSSAVLQQALAEKIKQQAAENRRDPSEEFSPKSSEISPPSQKLADSIRKIAEQPMDSEEVLPLASSPQPVESVTPPEAAPLPPPPPPPPIVMANKPLVITKSSKPKPKTLSRAEMIEAARIQREEKQKEDKRRLRQELEHAGKLKALTDEQIEEQINIALMLEKEAQQRELREANKDSAAKPMFAVGGKRRELKEAPEFKPKEPIIKGVPDSISSEFAAKLYRDLKPRGVPECSTADRRIIQDALKLRIEPLYASNKFKFDSKNAADAELLKKTIEEILIEVGAFQLIQAMPEDKKLASNEKLIQQQIKGLEDGKLLKGTNSLVEKFYLAMVTCFSEENDKIKIAARKVNFVLQKKDLALEVSSDKPDNIFDEIKQGMQLRKARADKVEIKPVSDSGDVAKPKLKFFKPTPPFIPGLSDTVVGFFADEFVKLFIKPLDPSGELLGQQQLEARLKNDVKSALKGQFELLPKVTISLDQAKDELVLSKTIYSILEILLKSEALVPKASADMFHLKSLIYGRDGTNPDSLLTTYAKIFAHSLRSYEQMQRVKVAQPAEQQISL